MNSGRKLAAAAPDGRITADTSLCYWFAVFDAKLPNRRRYAQKRRKPLDIGGLWQTGRIVLIEVWEHLRGYGKWTPTTATVESSTLSGIDFGESAGKQPLAWQSVCKIAWVDQHKVPHTAEFDVFEESPLYQLYDGDTIEIRFNPKMPDQFYLPGLIQSRLAKTWKVAIFAVLFILVLIAIAVAWFGPNILSAISR